MKIQSLRLSNYKKFQAQKTINFHLSENGLNDVSVLIGNNGSGKTSILQAVALLLGAVNRANFSHKKLNWAGFNIDFCKNATLNADLLDGEAKQVLATQAAFLPTKYLPLSHSTKEKPPTNLSTTGKCFWYTEQRSYASQSFDESLRKRTAVNIDDLRRILSLAFINKSPFYQKLSNLYSKIFPNRILLGSQAREGVNLALEPYFFLGEGKNRYELSGMSAGERVIFSILIDFANLDISNSIILIDELELHLHPPLQQQLARVLPSLGNNNQFIITTHSDYVAQMFDSNQLIYL